MHKRHLQLNGQLSLTFSNKKNKTVLSSLHQTPPLRASHALYPNDDCHAVVYLMETSGGMVSGDNNTYHLTVENHANVTLLQQSSAKIYPNKEDEMTSQTMNVHLGSDAFLHMVPDTIIPFEDAYFKNAGHISMKNSSHIIWGEILSSGRRAKGEKYKYRSIDLLTSIYREEKLCVYNRFRFSPKEKSYEQIGILDGFSYYATLWAGSPKLAHFSLENVKLSSAATTQGAITEVETGLFCLRWLSNDLIDVKNQLNRAATTFTEIIHTDK
ncbi:urease accessory protein UreD [Alteribacillus sp. JSM 102045]|uniref:urease accessory protein UreD n=1 Tax=Alteribacillus sp. JSM 102045 TaxID=1562101 RepID=UPI0035C19EB9